MTTIEDLTATAETPDAPDMPSPEDDLSPTLMPPGGKARRETRAEYRSRRADQVADRQLELDQDSVQTNRSLVTLIGTIIGIRFRGEDFFAIAQLRRPGSEDPVTVKGNLAGMTEWCDVELRGKWFVDPKWGRQFNFSEGEVKLPATEKGALRFMEDHLVSIGPGRARAILATFGQGPEGLAGIWAMLEHHPESLVEAGIAPQSALAEIVAEFKATRSLREHEIWLASLGVGPKRIRKILAKYGAETRTHLEADPYVIVDLKGIGFKLADDLGKRMGVTNDHPGRARAAVLHVLQEAADGEGHTYLPQSELLADTDELSVPADRILEIIELLVSPEGGGKLICEGEPGPGRKIALTGLADCEREIAEQILSRMIKPRGQVAAAIPAQSRGSQPRSPEFDHEKKLPALSKRAWKKSGRDLAPGAAPAPTSAPSALDLGRLEARTLSAQLGIARNTPGDAR